MTLEDEAQEIVRRTQTEHEAHLIAAFYLALVKDGVGRMIARDLTEKWIENRQEHEEV